ARILLELRIELLDELPSPTRELLHVLGAASHRVVRGIHHARRSHRLPPTDRLALLRARPMPLSERDGATTIVRASAATSSPAPPNPQPTRRSTPSRAPKPTSCARPRRPQAEITTLYRAPGHDRG